MLLDFKELVRKYDIKFNNVTVVGAHWGEEYDDFLFAGAKHITFIEPCQKAFSVLVEKFKDNPIVKLHNCACGEAFGQGIMYTGDYTVNNGQSNSLLKPSLHLDIHPTVLFPDTEEVSIAPLDQMLEQGKEPQLLYMDAQGYEGFVLKGAKETLKTVNWVYTEINFGEVYENCTKSEELDELLSDFDRVETGVKVGGLWSDSLYKRRILL